MFSRLRRLVISGAALAIIAVVPSSAQADTDWYCHACAPLCVYQTACDMECFELDFVACFRDNYDYCGGEVIHRCA